MEGQKIGIGTPEGLLEGSNDTLTTLHFTPKPTDDGKHLSCKSVNPALPKRIVEDEIILKVQCKYHFLKLKGFPKKVIFYYLRDKYIILLKR